jgi:hypothetical protein
LCLRESHGPSMGCLIYRVLSMTCAILLFRVVVEGDTTASAAGSCSPSIVDLFHPRLALKCHVYIDTSATIDISVPSLVSDNITAGSLNLVISIASVPVPLPDVVVYQDPTDFGDVIFGVALDGFPIVSPIHNGRDVVESLEFPIDGCGGSYGPVDVGVGVGVQHMYHYRTIPTCIIFTEDFVANQMRQKKISDVHELLDVYDTMSTPSIIGFSTQGYPIYSPFQSNGLLVSGLDTCGGKLHVNSTYAYYLQPTFPYIIGCLGPGVSASASSVPGAVTSSTLRCPGGYVISEGGCVPCPAGRYSSTASRLLPCNMIAPVGRYAPPGSTKAIKCPGGRYGISQGLSSPECSGSCSSGFFCPTGSIKKGEFPCLNSTIYCPAGSAAPVKVDDGFYSISEGGDGTLKTGQTMCSPGWYCYGGLRKPCPAGVFANESGLMYKNCSGICPLGHYCLEGQVEPVECPAGRYGASLGLSSSECSGLCSPGYWCAAGSTSPTENICAPGIFAPEGGLTSKECNPRCELGGGPNGTSPHGTQFCEHRKCDAGYICGAGSTSSQQQQCGDPNVFCGAGSVIPQPVAIGFYSTGPVSAPGALQNPADETTRTGEQLCEPGYYCTMGIKYICPASTYGSTFGLTSSSCSGYCREGYTCPVGSTSATQVPCGLDQSVYCPFASSQNVIIPPGFYATLNGTITTRSSYLSCPPGYFCPGDGSKQLCPAGRYSAFGSSTSSCDGLSDPGYYTLAGSTSSTQNICPPGRFGTKGSSSAYCTGACLKGYFCPAGSSSPFQNECGGQDVYCPHGSGAPIPVDIGFYSVGQNVTTRFAQSRCEKNAVPAGASPVALCPDTTVL